MDTLALVDALEQNTAALEWHGGILFFVCGVALALQFVFLVGFALMRGR